MKSKTEKLLKNKKWAGHKVQPILHYAQQKQNYFKWQARQTALPEFEIRKNVAFVECGSWHVAHSTCGPKPWLASEALYRIMSVFWRAMDPPTAVSTHHGPAAMEVVLIDLKSASLQVPMLAEVGPPQYWIPTGWSFLRSLPSAATPVILPED